MADPERNQPEPSPANDPVEPTPSTGPSGADDVTQQVPTQQTPAPPPTQQVPESGYQQQSYAPQDYGYGTPSYEQGGYGTPAYPAGYPMQPGYGYAPAQTEPLAIWGLVVAILAWVACPIPFVPAVVALVLASNAQRNIDASGGAKEGRGVNTATKILAWINIGVWGLVAIFVVVAVVASTAASG